MTASATIRGDRVVLRRTSEDDIGDVVGRHPDDLGHHRVVIDAEERT